MSDIFCNVQFVCSTVGCPYGDKCFFSHYIPNGTKSCLCYKFYTARGCSDYCVFAHGGEELRKPITYMGPLPFTGFEHLIPPVPVFRGHVQTKRSLVAPRDTMRMETWLVSRMSGAKISFEDHESDPSRVNVKMEGTLDDVNLATYLVRQYISCAGPKHVPQPAPSGEASFPH